MYYLEVNIGNQNNLEDIRNNEFVYIPEALSRARYSSYHIQGSVQSLGKS